MTTTKRQSSGSLSIGKVEAAISAFEAGFAKFQSNELVVTTSKKINRITFETLDLEQPSEFKLTLGTAAPPTGFSRIWRGAMFVNDTNTDVAAWRKD